VQISYSVSSSCFGTSSESSMSISMCTTATASRRRSILPTES
jgi:hypothetical protein